MDILSNIQTELKAPKNQRNNFGKYNYRSCEDILEGLKKPLKDNHASVTLSDSIEIVGNRIYVKSTAKLYANNTDGLFTVIAEATAFAREPESQKGMNEAQITGSASSYARKYALNGLFAIDDSKDADTNEHQDNANNRPVTNVTKIQKKFDGVVVDYRHEIFNLMESGKVPAADKEAYITKFKADSSLLNSKTVTEIKAKYFG
jgi:hypothetical protein